MKAKSTVEEPLLRLENISKTFGTANAVNPLDLSVKAGEFFAILGPSGCGKTTLLRIMGGFVRPTTGKVFIKGQDVTALGPERRPTNMVFQGYGLFPHMTVRQNIGYGLRIAGVSKQQSEAQIADAISLVRLDSLGERSVGALSGGQQQRVALARALVMRPPVLLLDEPLAALDLKLRQAMQEELRRIHSEIGGTFVFVTHDQNEAMSLANRIAVMTAGHIDQSGSPEEIYRRPRTIFAATFVGEANLLRGVRCNGMVQLSIGAGFDDPGPDGDIMVVVRPEAVAIADMSGPDLVALKGVVLERVFLGSVIRYRVDVGDGNALMIQSSSEHVADVLDVGQALTVGWKKTEQTVLAA